MVKKYINADLLRKEIDKWKEAMADAVGEYSDGVRFALEHFTFVLDSLQQEQQELPKIAEYYYHKGVYEGLSQGRADALKILEESMKRKADPVIVIKQQEVDLEKFTEKMDAWKARYNHPDDIPIKATMAFTARMFYMYPKAAREWYDSLPKATMD